MISCGVGQTKDFQVLLEIYATGDRGGARASGPSLIVAADNVAALPRHPTGKSWRYLATISDSDALLASRREIIEAALQSHGYFASRWALGVHAPRAASPRPAGRNGNGLAGLWQRAELAFRLPA
ncbi:hypothetical protein ASC89_20855 [Devosia sp. Root413D1]|nr:hypothetical protein ASC89_20855 [Devosia sp. Root413D1]